MKQEDIKSQEINSIEVVEAIQKYREKQDNDSLSDMIETMVNGKYLAPVSIESQTNPLAGEKVGKNFPMNMKVLFHMIENNQGVRYFLAFTSLEEMHKWRDDSEMPVAVVSFDDLYSMITQAPNDSVPGGFVINPYGINQVFTKEQTVSIKQQKDKIEAQRNGNQRFNEKEEVYIGEPTDYPIKLIKQVKKYLMTQVIIKKAYLQLMCQGDLESYLFVLDFEGEKEPVFNAFADAIRPYLDGKLVDLVDTNSELGANVAKSVKPFFQFE